MFDTWQQFGEVAWAMIDVELGKDDLLHAQAAGSGRPREQKHNGVAAHPGIRPRLNGRGLDFTVTQPAK